MPRFGDRMTFSHDPPARKVTGQDADKVMADIARWDGWGTLYGTQSVRAPDPLGSSRDMAVLLATCCWDLPPELLALLPPPLPIPEGAVA
jgi:hypothetical protein